MKASNHQDIQQKNYHFFSVSFDTQTRVLLLQLNKEKVLEFFDQNQPFKELKEIIRQIGSGQVVQIKFDDSAVAFDELDQFISYLGKEKTAVHLSFHSNKQTTAQERSNELLSSYYQYAIRKKQIDPDKIKNIDDLFRPLLKENDKIRRAKRMLNKGLRIEVHTQQQHHHHKEHGIQQAQEKQKQQHAEQQQFKERQNQIQQQQQRMQNLNRDLSEVNVNALGKLIHKNNLKDLVSESWPIAKIETLWSNLVGNYADFVEDPQNRITHVPEKTMRLIMEYKDQFSDGIHFDDLPNGFGFTVKNEQSILFFDKKLLKTDPNARQDSFLAARIERSRKPIATFGKIGQFYSFSEKTNVKEYDTFTKNNEVYFKRVFEPSTKTKKDERIHALIELMVADEANLQEQKEQLKTFFKDFTHNHIDGIRCILHEQGAQGILLLMEKLNELKQAKQYQHFKTIFMDTSNDWRSLTDTKTRPGELNALEALDYIRSMNPAERIWWQTMVDQHVKSNQSVDLIDLVNAQKYFFEQVKTIDPNLSLPAECPIKNIKNMKTAYARCLYLLQKAINPQEQALNLKNLDFSMQGFICGATRKGPYVLVSEQMDLTPTSGITDWNKFKKYAPKLPNERIQVFGEEDRDYNLPNEQGFATPLYKYKGKGFMAKMGFDAALWYGDQYQHLLTRDNDGYLVNRTVIQDWDGRAAWGESPSSYDKRIKDPEVQDEAVMTRKNTLSYGIDRDQLFDLSKKLHHFANLSRYFYRYIGTEVFAFKLQQYNQLLDQLNQATFDEDPVDYTVIPDAKQDIEGSLKKQLLVLLAFNASGPRALQEDRDVASDFEKLLMNVRSCVTNGFPILDVLTALNEKHRNVHPKSTLLEITSLLKLTQVQPSFMHGIINGFLDRVPEYGAPIYQAIVNTAHLSPHFTTEELSSFFDYLDKCKNKESIKNSLLIVLGSITKNEDWPKLPELIQAIDNIKSDQTLIQLQTVLSRINLSESNSVTVRDIHHLVDELCKIKENEKNPYAAVLGTTLTCLPEIRIKNNDISDSIAFFARTIGSFSQSITELLNEIKIDDLVNELDKGINSAIDSNEIKIPGLGSVKELGSQYKQRILDFSTKFLEKIHTELNELNELLKKINQEETKDDVKKALGKIQTIVGILENPLKDFSLGTGVKEQLLTMAAKKLIKDFAIKPVKSKILELVNAHLIKMLRLKISQSVQDLRINNGVLTNESEKDIHLNTEFNDFLTKQIPSLQGKEIAMEIDHAFKHYETINSFLSTLNKMGKESSRDEFIAFLYRSNHFKKPHISLEHLTSLLTLFRGCKDIPLSTSFESIFAACKNKMPFETISSFVSGLTQNAALLNNVQFQTLLNLGLNNQNGPLVANHLIAIKKQLAGSAMQNEAFSYLLNCSQQTASSHSESISDTIDKLNKLFVDRHLKPDLIAKWIIRSFENQTNDSSQQMNGLDATKKMAEFIHSSSLEMNNALTILNAACWERSEFRDVTLERQLSLINKLAQTPKILNNLAQTIYAYRPSPGLAALEDAVNAQDKTIDQWIMDYEKDPFGKRKDILPRYTLRGIDTFVHEISDLMNDNKIDPAIQKTLTENFAYVIAVSNQYGLPINNQIKPLREFTREELINYYNECVEKARQNPEDRKAKLEGLAVLCESMFRSTGNYPYHSQIISVINTIVFNGSLLQQIQTGQGKSMTIALTAAMNHSFGGEGMHTTVCSRNKLLTYRDFKENNDFFDYLKLPTAFVTSSTEENYYEKPTIVYTTAADKSLYDSKLKIVDHVDFPNRENQTIIADEIDADLFDSKNAFNFSEGNDDPYVNLLEWIYPLANEFIENNEFKNESILEYEDTLLFRSFVRTREPAQYEAFKEKLTDAKLSQLIDASCTAKQLQENLDFIIRTKERIVHGKIETISEAHVLVNHIEDKEATLSYGVQQALHARLNKAFQEDISQGKQPRFSCDNQIECVDSQNSRSFYKKFGRIIGCTGTAGTKEELKEAIEAFGIQTILDVPPRSQGVRRFLPTVFHRDTNSFFFGRSTHIEAVKRALNKSKNQPVMIACNNIDKAEEFYKALQARYGDKIQIIHAINADDPATFQSMVKKAGEPGQITIVTPLAGRGVDIKTRTNINDTQHKRSKAQQKLDALAEKLLVIETHLETYRNRRQLQGRTARDGKSGQVIGIFNLSDIASEHGKDLSKLSRQQKLSALTNIMDKMDAEARIERDVFSNVRDIIHRFEDRFDEALQTHRNDMDARQKIIDAKIKFIADSEKTWSDILAESDPEGRYENPYIRYVDFQLDRESLDKMVVDFKNKVGDIFVTCREQAELPQNQQKEAAVEQQQLAKPEPIANIQQGKPITLPEVYCKFMDADQNTNLPETCKTYQDTIRYQIKFSDQMKIWVYDNKKVKQPIKQLAKEIEGKVASFLLENGEHKNSYKLALIKAVTDVATNSPTAAKNALNELLPFYSMVLFDLKQQSEKLDDERLICKQILTFLQPVLNEQSEFSDLTKAINAFDEDNGIQRLNDLHRVVNKLIFLTQSNNKNRKTNAYLDHIKQFIDAAALTTSRPLGRHQENFLASNKEVDFKLMVGQLKQFLERSKKRMCSNTYKRLHLYAQSKIDDIDLFINNQCSEKTVSDFLSNNENEQNIFKLFEDFVNGTIKKDSSDGQLPTLEAILAYNTTWGSSIRTGKTTSSVKFKRFKETLIKQFNNSEENQIAANDYLEKLASILTNLKHRSEIGWFKDNDMYDKKIKKLEEYIDEVKCLISIKKENGIYDITDEIKLLKKRVENDPILCGSTAKFFKSTKNVTTVKDIQQAADEFLQRFNQ